MQQNMFLLIKYITFNLLKFNKNLYNKNLYNVNRRKREIMRHSE